MNVGIFGEIIAIAIALCICYVVFKIIVWDHETSKIQAEIDRSEKESEKIMRELESAARQQIREEKEALRPKIVKLLKDKGGKISVSDIDAFLKNNNLDMTKEVCKTLYNDGKINFAGNGRYFIIDEEKKKPKKSSAPKSEAIDVEKELEKLKGLLDKGLITQEQYDAKSNKLLGL